VVAQGVLARLKLILMAVDGDRVFHEFKLNCGECLCAKCCLELGAGEAEDRTGEVD
jgi:hypothetical protein